MANIAELTGLSYVSDRPLDDRVLRRGEVYFIDLEDINSITKHVSHKNRPGLIISNDIGNRYGSTVIVALLTSSIKKDYKFQYRAMLNGRESTIMFEQILTVDKTRVLDKHSELTYEQLKEAEMALMYSLALNRLSLENVRDVDVTGRVIRQTKAGENVYYEVEISFQGDQKTSIEISLENLQKFDPEITAHTSLEDLREKLDCCAGLNWLVNHNSIA